MMKDRNYQQRNLNSSQPLARPL